MGDEHVKRETGVPKDVFVCVGQREQVEAPAGGGEVHDLQLPRSAGPVVVPVLRRWSEESEWVASVPVVGRPSPRLRLPVTCVSL